VSKYLRIRDDLVQKRGVGYYRPVNFLKLLLVPKLIKQRLICQRQSEQILLPSVVRRQLRMGDGGKNRTLSRWRVWSGEGMLTEYCAYDLNVFMTFEK
jgi:hypothetical protein